MFKFVIMMALVFAAEAQNRVDFRPCPGNLPTPNWVESAFCTGSTCNFRRGQTFTARISFTPLEQFSNLNVAIQATWLGLPFPISIPADYSNACNFLEAGARCPVVAGTTYIWGLQFPIDPSYPATSNINMQGETLFRKIYAEDFLNLISITVSAGEGGRTTACAVITGNIV